jgi:integrase
MGLPDASPRTRRNHKTTICALFNWLLDRQHVTANPAAGIKKRMLPREVKKEIEFLSLEEVIRYLRTAERYDPDIVAHEVVQLIAGVRADDEMADFRAEFVFPKTKEVVIPAAVAKTEAREVIDGLEDNFWVWWREYAPRSGLLRPANYLRRWRRIRVLAAIADEKDADRLASIPVKRLFHLPEAAEALLKWPWNARRRTFCTFHIAKHQSAAKTALILRHRGSSYTLHNSYRGLGVSQEEGIAYFQILPAPVAKPVQPGIGKLSGAALRSSEVARSLEPEAAIA